MSRYFTPLEFERASKREPSVLERELARVTWAPLLDPLRDYYGSAIRITSYLRGKGSHAKGGAVDIQPAQGDDADIRRLADFAAALYRPGTDGSPLTQIIYEAPEAGQHRAHIHLARVLVQGATAGYLLDLKGNRRYQKVPIPTIQVVL